MNGARAEDLLVGGYALAVIPPNRIDILTTLDGVEFAAAWPGRLETTDGGLPVQVIGRRDLIANKRASGRPQDADGLEKA